MLVCQAAESFAIWFDGTRPDLEAAITVCRDYMEAGE